MTQNDFMKNKLGGSRMERKTYWKNFLLLVVGSVLALHINVSQAADSSPKSTSGTTTSSSVPTDDCVLEAE